MNGAINISGTNSTGIYVENNNGAAQFRCNNN